MAGSNELLESILLVQAIGSLTPAARFKCTKCSNLVQNELHGNIYSIPKFQIPESTLL